MGISVKAAGHASYCDNQALHYFSIEATHISRPLSSVMIGVQSVRVRIFSIADALIGGQPVAVSSGGGGGNSDSDLRWDGRSPDEEEEVYRRRCLLYASRLAKTKRNGQRKR